MNILAISGSLRTGSSNTELLRAAAQLAAPSMQFTLYGGLAELPAFNPDLMGHEPPAVLDLRAQVGTADGVLISSPEYGHGVPGALKNALDWLFSGEEFVGKPVALWNASPLSVHADASLRETIAVMSARLVEEACLTLAWPIRNLDATRIAALPEVPKALRGALAAFASLIGTGPATSVVPAYSLPNELAGCSASGNSYLTDSPRTPPPAATPPRGG